MKPKSTYAGHVLRARPGTGIFVSVFLVLFALTFEAMSLVISGVPASLNPEVLVRVLSKQNDELSICMESNNPPRGFE